MKERIKIDILIGKMSGGGAERVVALLANHLDFLGYDVRIITFQGEDAYSLNKGVKRLRLHRHYLFRSVVFNGTINLFVHYLKKSNRPDIMNSHIDILGYLTIPIAKLFGLKIIVSEHNNHLAYNNRAQKFLWDYLYPWTDVVTILTRFDLEYFSRKNKRVEVMSNPCTFEVIQGKESLADRKKEILLIGNLNRFLQKGFDNFMPVAARVLQRNPDWKIKIVGGGEYGLNMLQQFAKEAGVGNQLEFLGQRSDVQELLRKASIFVLPSRYEGLPMVLLEAMSQGTACVSYDCISGPADIITDGVDGILVPDQDRDALCERINYLIDNKDIRTKFHVNAPKALGKFSMETVGAKWDLLIRDIVQT